MMEKNMKKNLYICISPWTVAYQVPPSKGFFRQEHWSGLAFPSPSLYTHITELHCSSLEIIMLWIDYLSKKSLEIMNNHKVNPCATTTQVMGRSIFSSPGAPVSILDPIHPLTVLAFMAVFTSWLFFIVVLPIYSFLNQHLVLPVFELFIQIQVGCVFCCVLLPSLQWYVIICLNFYRCKAAFQYMNLLHAMYLLMDVWLISSLELLWFLDIL